MDGWMDVVSGWKCMDGQWVGEWLDVSESESVWIGGWVGGWNNLMYLSQCSSVWQRSWSTGTRHPPPQGTQWSARTQWDVVVGWEFFFFCCCMQINVKKEEELRNGTLACLNIIAGYESHTEVVLTVVLSKASKQVKCTSLFKLLSSKQVVLPSACCQDERGQGVVVCRWEAGRLANGTQRLHCTGTWWWRWRLESNLDRTNHTQLHQWKTGNIHVHIHVYIIAWPSCVQNSSIALWNQVVGIIRGHICNIWSHS